MSGRILVPDLVWRDGVFQRGVAVEIGADGRIGRVTTTAERDGGVVERLPGRALLPGCVNAHSHAFQRLLRGRAQWRPAGDEADFWSWRETMYGIAQTLTPDDVHAVARFCFLEMLAAGYTAVGEFHYLRNDPRGDPYDDPNEMAHRVIAAAREVGLRVVLLDSAYAAGGFGAPLSDHQRRFATSDLVRFLNGVEALGQRWREDCAVGVAVAAHSVRAVPREWLAPLAGWAEARNVPLHAHVAEQPAEVAGCLAAYGRRPVEILDDAGALGARMTAVHATHVEPGEVARLADAGATVCGCPTTERDLGDGFLPAFELKRAGIPLAIGSDSQTIIDPFEEMRLVEYHERLRWGRRVILGDDRDGRRETAPALLAMASEGGARSLGIEAGRIEPGAWADLVAVDTDHPALAGWADDDGVLASMLALTAPATVVRDVWVGGERRLDDRRHALAEESLEGFRVVAGRPAGG
jgi:formimidoylglutamate deiminase